MTAEALIPESSGGGSIAIHKLRKEFEGGSIAVDGIDLEIASGEFFSLLGPSGCGKTTTLRMLAGFEQPTAGKILIDGVDVAQTPPHKRPVNTVFQSYALFPHMDVWKNVEYGLRWTDVPKADRKPKVDAALELVEMTEYEKRRPNQLSGGQQQRVALARALVLEPSVLLLDEPLGALDAKLRHSLRAQLTSLQRRVGITFVFVTHDQEEALEMSDRLAVMSKGKIMQIGAPRDIYQFPKSEFVADVLGVANLMDVNVASGAGGIGPVKLGDFTLDAEIPAGYEAGPGRAVIRPESIFLEEGELTGDNRLPGMVERVVYLGSTSQVFVRLPNGSLVQSLVTNAAYEEPWASGDACRVRMPSDSLRVLEQSGEAAWSDDEGSPAPEDHDHKSDPVKAAWNATNWTPH
jgi:spermidine/putrescine transport system ATP-binding protein